MNLTKLFNFKYFKENVKKSKGIIALLLIIIPIFTTLFTVLVLNGEDLLISVPDKSEIAFVNFLGMYIIPVVLSFVLFGYVYKKKSVDFINSQPINRKTIFVTNTIGGILLIGIIQLITAIALLICSNVLPNVIIFPQMIFDIFIMFWIAYSFVFLATNLAMTVSGTFCTQIVLTMLILFLVPFCIDSYNSFSTWNNIDVVIGENSFRDFSKTDRHYTLPYQPITMMFSNITSEFDWFSAKSISRMVVLGMVYYFVGLHLFKKRKMENNEESFFNEKIHIIVKALTILPMIILLNILDAGKEFNIFAIAIIITYYFVYDFIVKRKMNLKFSIIYLVLTLAVLQGVCSGVQAIQNTNLSIEKINIDNISEIKIETYNYETRAAYAYNDVLKYGGYIDNREIIETIFESAYKMHDEKDIIEEDTQVLDAIAVNTIVETTQVINNEEDEDYSVTCDVLLKTKFGKTHSIHLTILKDDMNKVMEILSKDEKYLANIKSAYTREGIFTINNLMILDGEEKAEITKEIENTVNNMTLQELIELNDTTETAGINKYFYKDHKLMGIACRDSVSDKVLKIVSKRLNNAVIKQMNDKPGVHYSYNVFPKNLNYRIYFGTGNLEVEQFILDNKSEELDTTKPYYIINIGGRHALQFYTNKVDEIEKFIAKQIEYDENINYNEDFIESLDDEILKNIE